VRKLCEELKIMRALSQEQLFLYKQHHQLVILSTDVSLHDNVSEAKYFVISVNSFTFKANPLYE